jgi:hypothetical protein
MLPNQNETTRDCDCAAENGPAEAQHAPDVWLHDGVGAQGVCSCWQIASHHSATALAHEALAGRRVADGPASPFPLPRRRREAGPWNFDEPMEFLIGQNLTTTADMGDSDLQYELADHLLDHFC